MSWKRKRELIKAQVNLQLPQHSLVADCPTRWGSMAKMVSRILEQEEGIRVVLSTDRKTTHLIPTWQDMDVIQSINQALSPLSSLTNMLSGESYVTVSAVLPIVHLIENNLLKEEESDTQLTKDIKCRIKGDLNSRYEDLAEVTEILQIATFVDPRFKTKYLNETETADVQDKVITECSHLEIESTTLSTADASPPTKKKNLGTLFKDHEKTEEEDQMPVLSKEQQISSELLVYVKATKLDFEEDPLLWWKLESRKYPLLSILARKYLCVCATSSASERLFSSSGSIVSSSRASMKPEKVDMLTFLSKNL